MSNLFKKFNKIMNKKSQQIESDAAPSRPRSNEEIVNESSSSEEEEFDTLPNKEHSKRFDSSKPKETKPDENTIPEFEKNNTSSTSEGRQSFVQTNIHINNSPKTHIGNQFYINVQNPSTKGSNVTAEEELSQPPKPQPPPPKIEKTFSNRNEVKEADFILIKLEIGPYWRKVVQELDLEKSIIQQVYEDYKNEGTSEVFYQLMLKWKQLQPQTITTVGRLCEALWNANETNAANVLSKLHSSK